MISNETELILDKEIAELNEKLDSLCLECGNRFKIHGAFEQRDSRWYTCDLLISWNNFADFGSVNALDKKIRRVIQPLVENFSRNIEANKMKEIWAGCETTHSFDKDNNQAWQLRDIFTSHFFLDFYKKADELIKLGFFNSTAHLYSEVIKGNLRPRKYRNGGLYFDVRDCALLYNNSNKE